MHLVVGLSGCPAAIGAYRAPDTYGFDIGGQSATRTPATVAQQIRVLNRTFDTWRLSVSTNTFNVDAKIYNAPHVGALRRIQRPDGISFLTNVVDEQNGDATPRSVELELRVAAVHGILAITMRRVTSKPDSWYCSTSSISLPPEAAADLVPRELFPTH